jgi:hypothetical protein
VGGADILHVTMRVRSNWWWVGVVLVGILGCPTRGDPLGFPRIRVWVTDDAAGWKELLTIDPGGRFVLEAWTEVSPGKFKVEACPGQLPVARVAPVFASFDAAQLDGIKQTFGEPGHADSGPQTLLLYVGPREAGHPRDRDEFDRLDALVDELRVEASLHCVDHPRRE